MRKLTPFACDDYKDYLRKKLADPDAGWGSVTRLADAAGCQRSFLSRVLNGPIHLTPDHGHGLCEHWELTRAESEFFMLLLEKERASTQRYRKHIEAKLGALKREQENLSLRLNRPAPDMGQKEMVYYSAWHWSAVHIAVSIPELQTIPAIARRLQLPESLVASTLATLEGLGLVKRDGQRWGFASSELHLPKNSPLSSLHHSNWRQRATLDSQDASGSGVHFTVVQSMSLKAFEKIRRYAVEFVETASREAGPSKEEELVCIACDVFKA
jgi:uncharacterized protein (TIGR02147 family)